MDIPWNNKKIGGVEGIVFYHYQWKIVQTRARSNFALMFE
jgi:hypothetical protein